MPDEHNTPTNGVPFISEPFGNEHANFSERFGNVPNASERSSPRIPNASERFGNPAVSSSEGHDESLAHPPRRQAHTLTVREVEKLFEQAGRPVTERSILNWCKPNSEGICRLNCGYERGERRWYIASESVERVIEEERKKDQALPKSSLEFSEAQERLSETFGKDSGDVLERFGNVRKEEGRSFGNVPNASETSRIAIRHEEPQTERREVDHVRDEKYKEQLESLQKRLIELEREAAAGQYKDELITTLRERLNEDRRDYNERMQFFQTQVEKLQTTAERYVDELVGINRRVGELEAENRTLRQLPVGKSDTPSKESAADAFTPERNDNIAVDQRYH